MRCAEAIGSPLGIHLLSLLSSQRESYIILLAFPSAMAHSGTNEVSLQTVVFLYCYLEGCIKRYFPISF